MTKVADPPIHAIPVVSPLVARVDVPDMSKNVLSREWEQHFQLISNELTESSDHRADTDNPHDTDHGDLLGLTDSDDHSQYLYLDGRSGGQETYGGTDAGDDLSLKSTSHATKGTVFVGDDGDNVQLGGNASNYSEIEDDGTLVFHGDATVWDDIRIVPGSFDRPGVADPALVQYAVGGGGVFSYLYEFAVNDFACFTVQLPHKYKQGSDIYVHVHWTAGPNGVGENGTTVGWKIDYSWANINGAFGAMSTADLSDTVAGGNHIHLMTPEGTITGTGKTISSMLICNVKRSDTGVDDTWVGVGAGNLPMLLEIDFHFEIDTVGSREKSSK